MIGRLTHYLLEQAHNLERDNMDAQADECLELRRALQFQDFVTNNRSIHVCYALPDHICAWLASIGFRCEPISILWRDPFSSVVLHHTRIWEFV